MVPSTRCGLVWTSRGRKGAGVSGAVHCSKADTAALSWEGGRQSFRPFTAFWDFNLLFSTVLRASVPWAQPAVSAGGSPSPPARARLVQRDSEDESRALHPAAEDSFGERGIWGCRLEHKWDDRFLDYSTGLWAWPHPKMMLTALLLLVAGADRSKVSGSQ